MKSERLWLRACLVIGCAAWACAEKSTPAPAPAPVRLCGMDVEQAGGVRVEPESGEVPIVRVPGPMAWLALDNSEPKAEHLCTFDLVGPHVGRDTVFFRLGTRKRARLSARGAGRVRIDYVIGARSRGLISVEPRQGVFPDPQHVDLDGLQVQVRSGAVLRTDGEWLVVRSLSPDTRIQIDNRLPVERFVRLKLENTSDRLSRPVLTGLPSGVLRRTRPLALSLAGPLGAGQQAVLQLEPRPIDKPYTFVFGGDIADRLDVFLELLEEVRLKSNPLFLLLAGNMTRDSLPGELAEFDRRTAGIPFPMYTIKGEREGHCQGDAHYARRFGPAHHTLRVADLWILILDTSVMGKQGVGIAPERFDWLQQQLGQAAGATWKIIALQAPVPEPRQSAQPGDLRPGDADRLEELARVHQVAYLLSGLGRVFARSERHGTVYLTSAGAGAAANANARARKRAHLMLLRVQPAGIQEERIGLLR